METELFKSTTARLCGEFANKSTHAKVSKLIKRKDNHIEMVNRMIPAFTKFQRLRDEQLLVLLEENKRLKELISHYHITMDRMSNLFT